MLKKIAAMLLCAVLMASMLCCAMAEPAKAKSLKNLTADVNNANRQIRQLVKAAQKTPEDDEDELLAQVDEIVARVKAHAAAEGLDVACTMEDYFIDGRWVAIDPLMVVNIRQ